MINRGCTKLQWKNEELDKAETISGTFENHILLTVLHLIDSKLPIKTKEMFGPRIEKGKFLMDFKMDILHDVPKMLEAIANESDDTEDNFNATLHTMNEDTEENVFVNANLRPPRYTQRGNRGRGRGRPFFRRQPTGQNSRQGQYCRLCHLSRQPNHVVKSHEHGDLHCPSLSQRDREGLKTKLNINAIQLDENEEEQEEDVDQWAQDHGYDTGKNIDTSKHNIQTLPVPIFVIKPVPSQILTVYQNNIPIHLDLDSGAWISSVKEEYAKKMKWKLHPNGQLAKIADGKTVLKSIGEIHEIFNRNSWTVRFSAIILKDLHTDVIAGNNFIKDNNVIQDIPDKNIIIHKKFVVPETNR